MSGPSSNQYVGVFPVNTSLQPLEERLQQYFIHDCRDGLKKNLIYLMGNGKFSSKRLGRITSMFLEKHYPEFSSEDRPQVIFIPKYFVTGHAASTETTHAILDTKYYETKSQLLPEDQRLAASCRRVSYEGEIMEKRIYDRLKPLFERLCRKGPCRNVVVLHSYKILAFDATTGQIEKNLEKDFLIIVKESALIIIVEAKSSWSGKPFDQLFERRKTLDDWFGGDLSRKWKIATVIYCERLIFFSSKYCRHI